MSSGRGLDLADSALLAGVSELVYAGPAQLETELPRLGLDLVSIFDHRSTQGFVASTEAERIVAFRGTETSDRGDILSDADARRTATASGKVHTGLLRALDEVWDELEDTLRPDSGGNALWFTGHSLGGALAALAAARCVLERGMEVSGVHTFGQPRVGNRRFASRLDEALRHRYFRFINNEDTVPNLPLAFRFRHAGEMCWFDEQGRLAQLSGIRAWGRYSTQLFQIEASYEDGQWTRTTDTLADHSMANYRALVRRALAAEMSG